MRAAAEAFHRRAVNCQIPPVLPRHDLGESTSNQPVTTVNTATAPHGGASPTHPIMNNPANSTEKHPMFTDVIDHPVPSGRRRIHHQDMYTAPPQNQTYGTNGCGRTPPFLTTMATQE